MNRGDERPELPVEPVLRTDQAPGEQVDRENPRERNLVRFGIRGYCVGFRTAMAHNGAAYKDDRTLPRAISVNDTAAVLGISRATVYRLIQSGDLRPVRVGRRLRFRLEELDAYLERESGP
ncbi:hypothetical protein BH20ACT13_BH20ACT13_25870 [soil metagenome]